MNLRAVLGYFALCALALWIQVIAPAFELDPFLISPTTGFLVVWAGAIVTAVIVVREIVA